MPHPAPEPSGHTCGPGPGGVRSGTARSVRYERRRPELGALHRVVRDNLRTLDEAIEDGFAAPLPAFVHDELEAFVRCRVLAHGFALLRCPDCDRRIAVGFSCKGRGFCPSCAGRRMAETAANLVEHVIPQQASLRQWVLTLPFELRARLAFDGELLGAVCRTFVDSVLGAYRRRMDALGTAGGKSGAVTAVQRTSSDLRLNPHLHTLALDGVFTENEAGELSFHPLPALTNTDVAEVLQIARARILRLLRRKGVIEDEEVIADRQLADEQPALARLTDASVQGAPPAGPALHQREPIALRPRGELEVRGLCASEHGFSLHAATTAGAADAAGKEALCKYILRPPIAQDRVRLVDGDLVRLLLKRPFRDGTVAIDLDPLSLLVRLALSVPPPRFNTVRYGGVLAAHSQWRARIVPPPPPPADDHREPNDEGSTCSANRRPPTHRSGYRPWRELLKRTFKVDVERCAQCGARMTLRALVITTAAIDRILHWLGEPTEPPTFAPSRGPPFFKSHVIRRRLGVPEPAQAELFGAS